MLDYYRPRTRLDGTESTGQFLELRKTEVGLQLADLTLGIVGLGRIGKRMAALGHLLGMNVIGCDLLPEADLRKALPDVPFEFVDHASLYARSDIVTIHTDGRAENRHMIDAKALAHFRPEAMFINAARGMLVNDDDLAAWLRANSLA